jgi:hypothetical protein
MPDVPPLVVYPGLWELSRASFPDDAQWPDQLKLLCALARDYRCAHAREVSALPPGEQLFLQSLAEVDTADLIETLRKDYPGENPLMRIAPDDYNPHLDPQYRRTMNGHSHA